MEKLWEDLNINEIIEEEKISPSQKWDKIISALRNRRFPEWSRIEKKLVRSISSLGLPRGMKFNYPPYLEGEKFKIELEFSTSDELKAFGKKMLDISSRRELSEIFDLI